MTDWICKSHTGLSVPELYALLRLRAQVFVVEQQCCYQDLDGQDLQGATRHLLGWQDGQLAAYCRILDPATRDGEVAIGRVITAPFARGQGLGHALIRQAMTQARLHWPGTPLYLSAQAHLRHYYGQHGFTAVTGEYLEDGIPHIGMRLDASV